MQRIKTIIFSQNPERVLLALLFSAAAAWLLKDLFTSLIFTGKTFAGRALSVQILLLIPLFFIIFAIFIFLLRKVLDWLLQKAWLALTCLALVPLAAYAWMGSFSRFVSDDFSSAALAVRLGVWGAAVDWYMNWTGRFSANLIDSLTGYLGQKALGWQVLIVLLMWTAALTLLIRQLFPAAPWREKWLASLFLTAVLLTAAFQVTTDLPQSLYWAQGMHSLILPMALGTFLAAALLYLWGQTVASGRNLWWAAGTGLLAFLAGGFGETYVSLQTSMLALVFVFGLIITPAEFKKKILPVITVCLAASLLAMIIIILSPGNAARQSNFPPTPSLPGLLWISLQAFLSFLGGIFTSIQKVWQLVIVFVSTLLMGSGFLFPGKPETEPGQVRTGFRLTLIIMVSLGFVYACFVPSAYGMSTSPPGRTLVIPTFLLAEGIAAAGYTAGGSFRGINQKMMAGKPGLKRATAWILVLAFAANIVLTSRSILTLLPEYSRFARVSDKAEEIIWQAKTDGLESVEIPEVHNHFGLSDFGVGTNAWLDDAVDQYYGLHVIINKNLNKRYK
ncbi:MAG: DUF6056 family protein [Anaerolineaceae bacterium]